MVQQEGIVLERNLHNQRQDLLLRGLFTGRNIPASLIGLVRSFQTACIGQGIKDKLDFKQSLVKCCEIQIGTFHLDLTDLDEEKVEKCLEATESAEQANVSSKAGQIAWHFTRVNQFGSVTLRIKEGSWQVRFSRLQKCISALITNKTTLA